MLPLPSRFFVTSGKALSETSEMNAFDQALIAAGISEANLVPVSSVLPEGIMEIPPQPIARGTIVFCVMSRIDDRGGKTISAGLAYFNRKDGGGGYVAEGHLNGNTEELRARLEKIVSDMALHRSCTPERIGYRHEELEIPDGKFGSCVVALVFLP